MPRSLFYNVSYSERSQDLKFSWVCKENRDDLFLRQNGTQAALRLKPRRERGPLKVSLIYNPNKSRLERQGCKNKLKSLNGFHENLKAKNFCRFRFCQILSDDMKLPKSHVHTRMENTRFNLRNVCSWKRLFWIMISS